MRRTRAQLALCTLRVHPNGSVGRLFARVSLPSPGRWTVELRGAPSCLVPETVQVEAKGGRVLSLRCERFAEDAHPRHRSVWVDLQTRAAGPIELDLEGGLGWASWRCSSLCVQRPNRLDWSVWGEFWIEGALEPEDATLELSTRRLPTGATKPTAPSPGPVADEIAALAATRGGSAFDLASDHPDAPRLLDPEPADALGRHDVFRPTLWVLGPDGTGRARLASASTELPECCEVSVGQDGRPVPRLFWQGPCPIPEGMPAGPLIIEAFGRRVPRTLRRWAPSSLRAMDLGPDPRVEVERSVASNVDGPRQDVGVELRLRSSRAVEARCLELIPRSVDPQVRVDLYELEPRDTAFDAGLSRFRAPLEPGSATTLSARYVVTCSPGHHAVRVPEGPE